jgi:hypothetical protein
MPNNRSAFDWPLVSRVTPTDATTRLGKADFTSNATIESLSVCNDMQARLSQVHTLPTQIQDDDNVWL